MCGIFAILCKHKETQYENIKSSYNTLINRGPDSGSLTFTDKYIYGFRRLKIVDTSDKGDQPFISEDGKTILLCNGEIYNHKELEIKYNLNCKSESDCECILLLYKKLGFEKMIELLNGVFAIIILDGDNMYLARDRIGVRPLFYGMTKNGNFAAASTAKALINFCNLIYQMSPVINIYFSKRVRLLKKRL